jgi:uncharacterized membrane protein YkvA (DUF1232 family)
MADSPDGALRTAVAAVAPRHSCRFAAVAGQRLAVVRNLLTMCTSAPKLPARMRITLDLEPADIERFTAAFERVRRTTRCADEVEIIDAAKYALDHLGIGTAPAYVRKRLVEVQRLIMMLEDEAWSLADPERTDVLETLAYFSDPDDLIPDHIEVIGLLDDAIMLELLLRRLRKVRKAYADFCTYRDALRIDSADASLHEPHHARLLAERRAALHLRMRRRKTKGAAPEDESGLPPRDDDIAVERCAAP